MRTLPIPPDAEVADQAIEVFRGWSVDNRLQCSLHPSVWADEPEIWGMLLADVVSHVSKALSRVTDLTEEHIRFMLTERLISELRSPTTKHPGDFIERDED